MDALRRLYQVPLPAHTQDQWISLPLEKLYLSTRTNQDQQARSEDQLVMQKKRDVAIIICVSTMDPQDIGHLPAPTSATDLAETLKELQQLRLKNLEPIPTVQSNATVEELYESKNE